jgi:hypothetical protein
MLADRPGSGSVSRSKKNFALTRLAKTAALLLHFMHPDDVVAVK